MQRYFLVLIICSANIADAAHIIAHRGFACGAEENTTESVARAWRAGADAVEIDVRVSTDGVVYLYHDDVVSKTPVKDLSYSEFESLSGGGVAILSEVTALAHPPGYFVLDVKEKHQDRIRQIAIAVEQLGLSADQISFQSENLAVLSQLGELHPGSPMTYLTKLKWRVPYLVGPSAKAIVTKLKDTVIRRISIKGRSFVDRKFVSTLRAAGYEVHVWTINKPSRAAYYLDIGVDGIITDNIEGVLLKTGVSAASADLCEETSVRDR